MKGLILAGVSIGFLVAYCAASLRFYRGEKEYRVFVGSFLCAFMLYAALFASLPSDVGFLPRTVVDPVVVVDFMNGALVLVLIFHGIWTSAYLVSVGPTLSLLIEMSRRGNRGMTMEETLLQFRGTEQISLLMRRRLPKLVHGGYLAQHGDEYTLLPRGRIAAKLGARLKSAIGDRG